MGILTILDPRRGLETRLRKAWEEFFSLSEFILNNSKAVNFKIEKAANVVNLGNPADALKDPKYEKYFEKAFNPENPCIYCWQHIHITDNEFNQMDWEAPICKEAWEWLWFITYTATLTRIDALYLTPTLIERKNKNKTSKKYFYLKWVAIFYGENIHIDEYEVKKLSPEGKPIDKIPRKWKFDRKTLSLGYIPINIPEEIKEKIKSPQTLSSYLEENPPEEIIKAKTLRESFYLLKIKFKEIQVLEKLFLILRKKEKKLPYEKWLYQTKKLGISIISLKRLLKNKNNWFEFWEFLC